MPLIGRLPVLLALVGALLTIPSAPVAAQEVVTVSLTEFQVAAVPTSVVEGTVVFPVRNDGAVAHNLVVIRTDLAPDALPVDEDTYLVDEARVDVVASSVELLSGEATEVRADLAPGSYVLVCNNLATHYQAGMFLGFQVTAAPEPTATPVDQPTPTPRTSDSRPTGEPPPIVTQVVLPIAGQGADAGSSGSWWALAALAAAGAGLLGTSGVLAWLSVLRSRRR